MPAKRRLATWRRKWLREFVRAEGSFAQSLRSLPSDLFRRARTQGRWSVHDVLAHVVEWEKVALERLDLVRRGRGGEIFFYDERSGERFNREAVARRARSPTARLRRELRDLGVRLRRRTRALPLPSLADPSHRFAVREWLPEFTVDHLEHHARRLREFALERRYSGRSKGKARRRPRGRSSGWNPPTW